MPCHTFANLLHVSLHLHSEELRTPLAIAEYRGVNLLLIFHTLVSVLVVSQLFLNLLSLHSSLALV